MNDFIGRLIVVLVICLAGAFIYGATATSTKRDMAEQVCDAKGGVYLVARSKFVCVKLEQIK